ncbi:MAG: M16 family metallopeptidase, partial [Bacteroidia bacterium]
FFKANKDYPSQEAYLERVNELGIVFNGTTSDERVNYYVTLNKSKLTEGLEFMNSAARYPKFLKEEMEKENVVVAGEFQRNESNPVFFLLRDMRKKLWGKEFSRKNTIGEYPVILSATPAIMQDIKDRYYYPNNSMMVVAGDVDHNTVFSEIQRIYGDWQPSSFNIFEKYPIPEFEPIKYTQSFITENENAQVPILLISWHGPDTRRDLKATYAADVFSYILQQQNSKLQKALVESGLAYQVSVSYQTQKYTGPIQIFLVPNPERMQEAMETLYEHINQWDDPNYFTAEQIETAKEMLDIDDQYSKEQTSEYVHTVTYWWASANLDYYTNYVNNIKAVTREDINSYVSKYIKDKPYIAGLLIHPSMKGMLPLDSIFPVAGDIESLVITGKANENMVVDESVTKTLSSLKELLRLNPDKKVKIDVYAAKKSVAETRAYQLKSELKKLGVEEDKYTVNYIVRKDKEFSAADKPKQNTIRFSF